MITKEDIERLWEEFCEEYWQDYFDGDGYGAMFKDFLLEKTTVSPKQLITSQSTGGQSEGKHLVGPNMGVDGFGHAGKPNSNDYEDGQRSTSQPSDTITNDSLSRIKNVSEVTKNVTKETENISTCEKNE